MKPLTTAAALCLALAVTPLLSPQAQAQTRTRRSPTSSAQRRRGGTTTSTKPDQTQINTARIKLADRIKTLSRFLYLYGRIEKDLELTGTQAGSSDAVAKSKSALVSNISDVRQGLDDLVAQFRFTPGLEQQSAALTSAAQRAADAESQVSAGQFHQAGLTLVAVVQQLTDVLIEM